MKVFVSWSGGKDCMLALHRVWKDNQYQITHLVNMCDADEQHSRSHGLKKHLIAQQASAMGIDIVQQTTDFKEYESNFKKVIAQLKKQGISGGVFGDIYLEVHRQWIERVCAQMEIQAIFPLWENNTVELINEFVNAGFKALTVSVHHKHLPQNWLGREINHAFIEDITKLEGVDPCAENGEYHSFVIDGPVFHSPVTFARGKEYFNDNHWFLELN